MKLKALLLGFALLLSANASAQFVSGLGYYHVHQSDLDLDVGALAGSVGYQFDLNDAVSIVPELRGGIGLQEDTALGVDVKVDNLIAAAVRVQWAVSDPVYLYTVASYGEYEFKFDGRGISSFNLSGDDSGFGGGLGFNLADEFSIEAGYEDIAGLDIFSASARFRF
ncbi:MAG: outer membrane beta-barrel protein [Wenzhouxiangella sp.]|nr:outer membrane beta-barrel protein [Wenzhouxiangella sp.]